MKNRNLYSAAGVLISLMIGVSLGFIINKRTLGIEIGLILGAVITLFFQRKK